MEFDPQKDYYAVLGVSKKASKAEIKAAFRKSAMQYHPDRQSGKSDEERKSAEAKFKEMNEAYEVLSDDEKRGQYDHMREMGANGGFGRFGGFGRMGGMGGFSRMGGFGFGGFDPFGEEQDYTTVKPKPSVSPSQGPVAKVVVDISFEESIYGVKNKPFRAEVLRKCSRCGGTGGSEDWRKCDVCGGTGWLRRTRGMMTSISNCPNCHSTGWVRSGNCPHCTNGVVPEVHEFTVGVPRGSLNGTLLRLGGAGHDGEFGGPRGDLVAMVRVAPSDRFATGDDGESLFTVHRISPVTAILGNDGEEVATPWGICSVKIPKGCTSGTKLRLRGQGMPDRHDGGHSYGDLYVIIDVDIPSSFDDKDLKKMESFRKWYENSSLNAAVNAERQRDENYVKDVKAKYDVGR